MSAVIYCRVSSKEQVDGTSLESQELACREYAARNRMNVARVFVERGESAKFADRTQLLELLAFCRDNTNAVDCMLVWKVDRLARNVGDLLVLIPTTGDAQNDAGGRILRLSAPTKRETYDADLRRFREQAGKQFNAWTSSLDPHQSRTDILGALDTARQELAMLPRETERNLIVVSDFLEDDGTYDFMSDQMLESPTRARALAVRLHGQHNITLQGVPLCLGRLESNDLASLSVERREAVQAFWTAYFAATGEPAEIQFDGTGILAITQRGCMGGKRKYVSRI